MSLLEVKNLRIEYPSRYGVLAAVKDLSFSVEKGEIVGVVGESGAGKSTIGNAVIDLLSPLAVSPVATSISMANSSPARARTRCGPFEGRASASSSRTP